MGVMGQKLRTELSISFRRRERLPIPVFLPGEFHGLCNSPWGCKELDTTERLSCSSSLLVIVGPWWLGKSSASGFKRESGEKRRLGIGVPTLFPLWFSADAVPTCHWNYNWNGLNNVQVYFFTAFLVICVLIQRKWNFTCPVWFFATPWTVTHQAPPCMEFSRKEYWNG